jgi:hypothetical protein
MGLTKPPEDRFEAINCTLPKEDVELAKELGTVVKPDGRTVINTSLGFRRVFETVRIVGIVLSILQQIQENPEKAKELADSFFATYYGTATTDS